MSERLALAALVVLAAGCQRNDEPCRLSGATRELTLAPNLDDDDGDGRIDGVQPRPAADDGEVAWLELTGHCQGQWTVRGAPTGEVRLWPSPSVAPGAAPGSVESVRRLGVEVVRGRSPLWGGTAELVGPGGTVKLTAAPVLLRQPNQKPTEVWAAEVAREPLEPNLEFLEQLEEALPTGVVLRRLGGDAVGADRWVQDAFQAGSALGKPLVVRLPRTGPTRKLGALSHRDGLPQDVGTLGTGALGGSIFDFGGNLDVLAPHQAGDRAHPHGRLLIGGAPPGGAEPVSAELLAWLEAQGAQGPPVRLPVTWLYSGHLDDALLALPSPPGTVRVLLASPADALAVLDGARARPPEWKTPAFAAFTQRCQRELDAMEAALRVAIAPAPLETVRLPVLFVARQGRGESLAWPAYPNPVNALVVAPVVVVGDLTSPSLGTRQAQVLRREIEARLQAAGLVAKWVDVSAYAARGGSVHCAVEALAR